MADPTLVTNPDLTAAVAANNVLLTQLVSFIQHGTLGGASAAVIQWLKTRPGLSKYWAVLSDRGKVWLGAIIAALGSLGISATMSHQHGEVGVYTLVVSGLTLASVGTHVWSFTQSWLTQQFSYQIVIKPKPVTGVPVIPGAPIPQAAPVVVAGVNP